MKKLLLIENGNLVYLLNGELSISYETLEEFNHETGMDMATEYLCYDPDRKLYINTSLSQGNIWNGEHTEFEEILANIGGLIAKRDPYYGCDLQQAKDKCKQKIKLSYYTILEMGYTDSATNITWDCDDAAIYNTMAALKMMELTGLNTIEFIDHSNNKHQLIYDELKAMGLKIGAWWQALKYQKNVIYGQIDACETIDQVKAIVWTNPIMPS